jgi:hypothetical protein
MRAPRLLTLLGVALALPTLGVAQPIPDHLACYKVKDRGPRGRSTLTVTNAGGAQSCSVKLPAQLGCLESVKSNVAPAPPGSGPQPGAAGNFLCYHLKCSKPFPPDVEMTDQLGGQRIVRVRGAQFLCVPATQGVAVTPTPTSSTSTTLPGPCDFDSNDRVCRGSCSNGGRCSAVAAGGACECRTESCGDASAPECNGFCERDEACIFTVTGCSCATIP